MSDKNMADVADRAVDGLEKIAEAFGKVAPGLWRSMVEYEQTSAIVSLTTCVVFLVVPAIVVVAAFRKHGNLDDSRENTEAREACVGITIAGMAFFAIALIAFVCSTPDNVAAIRSPEAAAAKEMLSNLKGSE